MSAPWKILSHPAPPGKKETPVYITFQGHPHSLTTTKMLRFKNNLQESHALKIEKSLLHLIGLESLYWGVTSDFKPHFFLKRLKYLI